MTSKSRICASRKQSSTLQARPTASVSFLLFRWPWAAYVARGSASAMTRSFMVASPVLEVEVHSRQFSRGCPRRHWTGSLNLAGRRADADRDVGVVAKYPLDPGLLEEDLEPFFERARVARKLVGAKRVGVQLQAASLRLLDE